MFGGKWVFPKPTAALNFLSSELESQKIIKNMLHYK